MDVLNTKEYKELQNKYNNLEHKYKKLEKEYNDLDNECREKARLFLDLVKIKLHETFTEHQII
jgi:cell division protein FtsB